MTGPAERWDRVQNLLHEALDQPAISRNEWLRTACHGDDALVGEVLSLLAAHEGDGLLGKGISAPRLYGVSATHIGPYRILRPLGRGGMGVVYLAERRAGDVTHLVALKLLPPGLVSAPLVARFAEERRILARLEHAGIARLIDAGATPDGQPYVAMEFVEGVDLISWATKRRLTITDRLRLMLAVCNAVEYAHRQLVVHRDLKPSNILVTDDGKPKLLDFGIAKFLEPEPSAAARTRTLHWLTPDYASPEQVRGEPVGTGADVYSLGVLLFELLTDVRPFQLDGLSPAAMEQVICHLPPPRPSERVASRGTRRLLRGDLDTIVLKALAKEPERRYDSVRALDEDLRHYLDQEPVRARPDTLAYRTLMFVRRHRAGVAAAGIVFAALVGGLAAVGWQASEARRAQGRAESALRASQDVSAFLVDLFQSSNPDASPADTAVARAIVRRGVARADALADQPLAQARILDALGMVHLSLGQYDTAYALVSRALGRRRAELGPSHQDVAESLRHLGRIERARAHYRAADSAYRSALAIHQGGTDQRAVIATLDELGFLMPYLGREGQAEDYRREALALTRRHFPTDDAQITGRIILLASILRRRGDYDEAIPLQREALANRRRQFGPRSWETAEALLLLGDVLREAARTPAESEPLYRDAIVAMRSLGPRDLRVVHGLTTLASRLTDTGQFPEAEQLLREALEIRRHALGPEHPSVAESMEPLAHAIARSGRFAEGERMHRAALAMWQRTVGPDHVAVASNLSSLANLLESAGRLAESEALLRQAIAIRVRRLGPGHVLIGVTLNELGPILAREGKLAEAESTLLRGLAILRAHQLPTHHDVRRAERRLADLYSLMDRPADAAQHRALASP